MKIESERKNTSSDEVVLLLATGEDGYPNVALLSYLDLSILSKWRPLFAVGAGSSTSANLVRAGKASLVSWINE